MMISTLGTYVFNILNSYYIQLFNNVILVYINYMYIYCMHVCLRI